MKRIAWNKGIPMSESAKRKVSLANKGGNSGSFKKGIIPWSKGKKLKRTKGSWNEGHEPWNKGLKGVQISWRKGKKYPEITGSKHPFWKADNVGKPALHSWVNRRLGKPNKCEFCKTKGLSGHSIHWANKSGEYKRDLEDWLRLCVPCHKRYDLNRLAKIN